MRTRPSKGNLASPGPRPRSQYSSNPMHWLFRSNLPHRRTSAAYSDLGRRNFFGMSEIFNVLLNVRHQTWRQLRCSILLTYSQPSETVRSLTESKRLLEEARNEINETRERSQLRTKHTFTRLPGFLSREAEMLAIERVLAGEPSFTILFGASSVGKVRSLMSKRYHPYTSDARLPSYERFSPETCIM